MTENKILKNLEKLKEKLGDIYWFPEIGLNVLD